jgi:hypothetical protein
MWIWQIWKISQLEIAQRGHSLSLFSMYLCMLAERQLGVYICLQLHSNHGDCVYAMAKITPIISHATTKFHGLNVA